MEHQGASRSALGRKQSPSSAVITAVASKDPKLNRPKQKQKQKRYLQAFLLLW